MILQYEVFFKVYPFIKARTYRLRLVYNIDKRHWGDKNIYVKFFSIVLNLYFQTKQRAER